MSKVLYILFQNVAYFLVFGTHNTLGLVSCRARPHLRFDRFVHYRAQHSASKLLWYYIAANILVKGSKSVSTFDLSTLYTSIPHIQLKDNLSEFVDRIFDIKETKFIIPNINKNEKSYFSDNFCGNKK